MISLRTLLAAAVVATAFAACTDDSSREDTIGRAEDAFELRNYAAAQIICDSLISGRQFADLSVDQLCRLSILTARLAEQTDEESNMALAARCMQSALQRHPDSVLLFIQSLPADQQSSSQLIRQLTRSLDRDTADTALIDIHDAEPDSLYSDIQ